MENLKKNGYGEGGDRRRILTSMKKMSNLSDKFFDDVAPRLYIFCFLVLFIVPQSVKKFGVFFFDSHKILTEYIRKPRSGDFVQNSHILCLLLFS